VVEGSQPGLRQVVLIAALAVAVVLGAAVITNLMPAPIQAFVYDAPVAIAILIGGTAFVLWRVAVRRPPED